MLRYQILMSTTRRRLLTDFINFENNRIIKFCSTYRRYSKVCKIHFCFKSYSERLRRNQRCDVHATENE